MPTGRTKVIASPIDLTPVTQDDWSKAYFSYILCHGLPMFNSNNDTWTPKTLANSYPYIIHSPLNLQHWEDLIVGHTYDSTVVDLGGVTGIVCAAVIYKDTFWQLADDVKEGKWSVSMECFFDGFDLYYRGETINPDHELWDKLLPYARNSYENDPVVRVLGGSGDEAKVLFSASALVSVPADPSAKILEHIGTDFNSSPKLTTVNEVAASARMVAVSREPIVLGGGRLKSAADVDATVVDLQNIAAPRRSGIFTGAAPTDACSGVGEGATAAVAAEGAPAEGTGAADAQSGGNIAPRTAASAAPRNTSPDNDTRGESEMTPEQITKLIEDGVKAAVQPFVEATTTAVNGITETVNGLAESVSALTAQAESSANAQVCAARIAEVSAFTEVDDGLRLLAETLEDAAWAAVVAKLSAAITSPVADPPVQSGAASDPPAADPPVADPPAAAPPAEAGATADPPAADPPATDPPVASPSAGAGAVAGPPAADPPAADPPAEAGATQPEDDIGADPGAAPAPPGGAPGTPAIAESAPPGASSEVQSMWDIADAHRPASATAANKDSFIITTPDGKTATLADVDNAPTYENQTDGYLRLWGIKPE